MATYAETQIEPDAANLWLVPSEYTLYLACPPIGGMGYIEVAPDSDNPTQFAVTGIPADTRPATVARHVASLLIAAHPDELLWSAVCHLPARTVVKSIRDGNRALVEDATHWTGKACIGWFGATDES